MIIDASWIRGVNSHHSVLLLFLFRGPVQKYSRKQCDEAKNTHQNTLMVYFSLSAPSGVILLPSEVTVPPSEVTKPPSVVIIVPPLVIVLPSQPGKYVAPQPMAPPNTNSRFAPDPLRC